MGDDVRDTMTARFDTHGYCLGTGLIQLLSSLRTALCQESRIPRGRLAVRVGDPYLFPSSARCERSKRTQPRSWLPGVPSLERHFPSPDNVSARLYVLCYFHALPIFARTNLQATMFNLHFQSAHYIAHTHVEHHEFEKDKLAASLNIAATRTSPLPPLIRTVQISGLPLSFRPSLFRTLGSWCFKVNAGVSGRVRVYPIHM